MPQMSPLKWSELLMLTFMMMFTLLITLTFIPFIFLIMKNKNFKFYYKWTIIW